MVKFCIKLGELNKKLIVPFLLAVVQIIYSTFDALYPEKGKNPLLELYSISLSNMAVVFIPKIKFFSPSNIETKEKCKCNKKNFIDYLIFIGIFSTDRIISLINIMIDNYTDAHKSVYFLLSGILTTKDGIQIIFITIVCMLLLKYKYFIHHYISISFFFVLSIGNDLVLGNYAGFTVVPVYQIILRFIGFFTAGGYLCYIKYMMDRQYHLYGNIMLVLGINLMIINSGFLLYILLSPREGDNNFIKKFWNYFSQNTVGIIVSKFIVSFIIQFIISVLKILTIYYLSVEYIFVTQTASKIFVILLKKSDFKYIYICVIFFVLQFFSLMIYLEVLELNFLNLNKNTRRNIKSRINDDNCERNDSFIEGGFETEGGYICQNEDSEQNNSADIKEEDDPKDLDEDK